jgi:hypothetical protein
MFQPFRAFRSSYALKEKVKEGEANIDVGLVFPEIPGMPGTTFAEKGFRTELAWNMSSLMGTTRRWLVTISAWGPIKRRSGSSYITDDHHRRLLSGDHLHHRLLGEWNQRKLARKMRLDLALSSSFIAISAS